MRETLPSQNIELLRSFLGKKIVSVKRQLFKDDMYLEEYEQNADGPIELSFNDGTVAHFVAKIETYSVGVLAGGMPRYGSSYAQFDVSNNIFWRDRVDQQIRQVAILRASDWSEDYPSEFGIDILFENGSTVLIECLDEQECPDMIKVAEKYTGWPYASWITTVIVS